MKLKCGRLAEPLLIIVVILAGYLVGLFFCIRNDAVSKDEAYIKRIDGDVARQIEEYQKRKQHESKTSN